MPVSEMVQAAAGLLLYVLVWVAPLVRVALEQSVVAMLVVATTSVASLISSRVSVPGPEMAVLSPSQVVLVARSQETVVPSPSQVA